MASVQELFDRLPKSAHDGIQNALQPGERLQAIIIGEQKMVLVATDRRVFIFKQGITSGAFFSKQLNSWDYLNISGIQVKSGMTTQVVVVEVYGVPPVTDTSRFGKGPNSAWQAPNAIVLGKKIDLTSTISMVRRAIAEHHRPQAHPQAEPDQSLSIAMGRINELKRLGELKNSGLVSEEEFQLLKKQILGLT